MRILTCIIYFVCISFLPGCHDQQPSRNDIIGVWISEDGGKFLFQEDGSFIAENLSGSKIFFGFSEYSKTIFTGLGKWEFKEASGGSFVILNFEKSEKLNEGFSMQLAISGDGLFKNKPPLRLLAWIGDPDNMDKYEFKKAIL